MLLVVLFQHPITILERDFAKKSSKKYGAVKAQKQSHHA